MFNIFKTKKNIDELKMENEELRRKNEFLVQRIKQQNDDIEYLRKLNNVPTLINEQPEKIKINNVGEIKLPILFSVVSKIEEYRHHFAAIFYYDREKKIRIDYHLTKEAFYRSKYKKELLMNIFNLLADEIIRKL